jgi:hypothetical protein
VTFTKFIFVKQTNIWERNGLECACVGRVWKVTWKLKLKDCKFNWFQAGKFKLRWIYGTWTICIDLLVFFLPRNRWNQGKYYVTWRVLLFLVVIWHWTTWRIDAKSSSNRWIQSTYHFVICSLIERNSKKAATQANQKCKFSSSRHPNDSKANERMMNWSTISC